RLAMLVGGLAALGIAAAPVFMALEQNHVPFFAPPQVVAEEAPIGRAVCIGGLDVAVSVKRHDGRRRVQFTVPDTAQRIPVLYQGLLPDLFREGKGVVTQGALGDDGVFRATEVLAKHDENYMPVEAAYALEKAHKATEQAARTIDA